MTEQRMTRSDIKRTAIIDGAQRAFKQFGVGKTSMDRVAEMAQVSKRTVYNHFESKEVLVTHIIRHIWSKTIVAYDVLYDSDSDIKAQLFELVLNEVSFSQNNEFIELVRVAINYTFFSPETFRVEMRQFFEQETALIRWLKDANDDGQFSGLDPLKANEQIIGLLKGQAFWPQILRFDAPLTDEECKTLADETVELIWCRYGK